MGITSSSSAKMCNDIESAVIIPQKVNSLFQTGLIWLKRFFCLFVFLDQNYEELENIFYNVIYTHILEAILRKVM